MANDPLTPQALPRQSGESRASDQPKSLFEMFIRFLEHEHGKALAPNSSGT